MKRGDLIAIIEQADTAIQCVFDAWATNKNLSAAMAELRNAKEETEAAIKWWESDDD
jgi:hypothetical protein